MIKTKLAVVALAAAMFISAVPSAFAITSAQRVAVLRYNQCMATVHIASLCAHYLPGH